MVLGIKDWVNLYEKFWFRYEFLYFGLVEVIKEKIEVWEVVYCRVKVLIWDNVVDLMIGGFKFGFWIYFFMFCLFFMLLFIFLMKNSVFGVLDVYFFCCMLGLLVRVVVLIKV